MDILKFIPDETEDVGSQPPPQKRQRSESPMNLEDNLEDIMGENWGQLSFMPLSEQIRPPSSLLQTNDQTANNLEFSSESQADEPVTGDLQGPSADLAAKSLLSTTRSSLGGPTKRVKFQLDEEKMLQSDDGKVAPRVVVEATQGAMACTTATPDDPGGHGRSRG